MKRTLIQPPNHPAPRGAYSPGLLVEHGGSSTLYLTGQLAVDPEGKVVAPFDAAAQTEYVFGLIGSILRAAGMDFGDVVVHVFQDDARSSYDLDGLWMDARRIPLPIPEELR